MSDSNDKLDELFRNRFEEVELPVSDKLLANIKQELSIPKRKRRFGFWIWITSGIIIVAGIAGIVMYDFKGTANKNEGNIALLDTAESIDNTTVNSNSEIKEENAAATDEEGENGQSTQNQEVTAQTQEPGSADTRNLLQETIAQSDNSSAKKSAVISEVPKEKVEKQESNNNKKSQAFTSETSKSTAFAASAQSQTKAENNQQKEVKKTESKTASTQTDKKDTESAKNTTIQEQSPEAKSKVGMENENLANTGNNKEEQTKATQEQVVSSPTDNKQQAKKDSLAATADTTAIAEVKKNADTLKSKPKEEPKQETAQSKNFSFFVELNGGPSQSFRTFSSGANYTGIQREAEKPISAYIAGIDVGILFKNKYQFTMGLGIDNKGEKYQFEGQEAVFETYDSVLMGWDSVIVGWDSITMDTIWGFDTVYTTVTDTQQVQAAIAAKNVKNKYQYFRIPVMFGYRFNIGEKWFVTPNVGVIANYLISGSSTWFDEEKQQYITYDTRDKYRTLVIAGRAKIDIGFNVNDKWSILVQPGYTRFLQSIYRKEEPFKHNPYSYDLNFAVRYTFQ